MAFCTKCGNQVEDGVQFCTSCGATMAGKSAKSAIMETQTGELQADPNDAEENKLMAVIVFCIIGIVNAVNGKMKPLPIIGNFTIIR